MKTRFTLTFTVDLPYPDEKTYPGCSTPQEAVEMEIKHFRDYRETWLEFMLLDSVPSVPLDLQLEGHVIEVSHNESDDLNTRLNALALEMADLDLDNPHDLEARRRLNKEYSGTYAKLLQLRSDK